MFEFNHVKPSDKDADYNNLIRRVISSDQLDEIDKCVLLCRQCHGILHAQGIVGKVQYTVNVSGKRATQTLRGQIIADKKERSIKFLTNERVLVIPYYLKIGEQKSQMYFGTELEKGGVLQKYFLDLPQIKTLTVMTYRDSRILMHVEHITGNFMKMKFDVGFPVLTSEFGGAEKENPFIWLRNGVALTRDGEVIYNGTVTCEGTIPGL